MNKTTILVGSMRNGNSAFLAKKISEELAETNVFNLGGNIQYCTGCLQCDETHKCYIHDDMDIILPAIMESENIIIITPVRYSLMSGDVKVFIDRLNPTAVSEDICGKTLLAIAVGQTTEEEGTIQEAIKSIEMFANNASLEFAGGFAFFSCYGADEVSHHSDEIAQMIQWVKERLK